MQISEIASHHQKIQSDANMCIDRDIIRIIVREEHEEELEKIKREREKIKSTLKLVRKQHDLPPEAEKIIDSLLS